VFVFDTEVPLPSVLLLLKVLLLPLDLHTNQVQACILEFRHLTVGKQQQQGQHK